MSTLFKVDELHVVDVERIAYVFCDNESYINGKHKKPALRIGLAPQGQMHVEFDEFCDAQAVKWKLFEILGLNDKK